MQYFFYNIIMIVINKKYTCFKQIIRYIKISYKKTISFLIVFIYYSPNCFPQFGQNLLPLFGVPQSGQNLAPAGAACAP